MREDAAEPGWLALLRPQWVLALVVLLGGVLLHSMNVLVTATLLPSVVVDVGGADFMSWPTTSFLAASIVAATGTGILTAAVGARRAFCTGAGIYSAGAILCGLAPSMSEVIAGRFVQGLGAGFSLPWPMSWCALCFRRCFGPACSGSSQAFGRFRYCAARLSAASSRPTATGEAPSLPWRRSAACSASSRFTFCRAMPLAKTHRRRQRLSCGWP
jgi:MFS family permease